MTRKNGFLVLLVAVLVAGLVVPYVLAEEDREDRELRDNRERERRVHRPPPSRIDAERMERMVDLVERMRDICFEPPSAAMIALGGLKQEVRRKPTVIIADLEARLKETKTLGLRNAIRLTLKDLYKIQAEDEKVLEHLRAMLKENDAAIQKELVKKKD